jgi:tRNA(fMet)-specific endonuclease VapC
VTRLLFDTTSLIDAERSGGELDDLIDDDDDVAVAAVTIAELRVGALLAKGKRRTTRTAYVDDVIATIPALEYDLDVAEAHAELLVQVRAQGKPRGAHDLIIAATAKAFDRTIVSADTSAFRDLTGIKIRSHR